MENFEKIQEFINKVSEFIKEFTKILKTFIDSWHKEVKFGE